MRWRTKKGARREVMNAVLRFTVRRCRNVTWPRLGQCLCSVAVEKQTRKDYEPRTGGRRSGEQPRSWGSEVQGTWPTGCRVRKAAMLVERVREHPRQREAWCMPEGENGSGQPRNAAPVSDPQYEKAHAEGEQCGPVRNSREVGVRTG